jgi:hypothetical protein
MASVVDICNLALARLGDDATVASVDPPEGSAQAEHCARFYPIARDSLLELHDWKFATRRAPLALLTETAAPWAYAYAQPAQTIRIVSVLPPTASSDAESQPYDMETAGDGTVMILTDVANAVARYTVRVTDPTRFSPLFTDALATLLASYVAGPVIKGDAGKAEARAQLQHFQRQLAAAKVSDANQRRVELDHMPGWIAGR